MRLFMVFIALSVNVCLFCYRNINMLGNRCCHRPLWEYAVAYGLCKIQLEISDKIVSTFDGHL